jgi:hypothetical protein
MSSGRSRGVLAARKIATRRLPLAREMTLLVVCLAVWQAARVPLEGSMAISLDHARDWLSLERALHLDVEEPFLDFAHTSGLFGILSWGYENLHLAVLFAFMASVRLLAPERYPLLRTAFVLAHVPALVAIGLYPLAPPRWVAEMPYGTAPGPDWNGPWTNSVAAVVSMHVGYPIFIAASTIWLTRKRVALLTLAYPALVLAIVMGTGNHYFLDAVTGGLAVALGFAAARLIHHERAARRPSIALPRGQVFLTSVGYGLTAAAVSAALEGRLAIEEAGPTALLLLGPVLIAAGGWWGGRTNTPPPACATSRDERGRVDRIRYWLSRAHSPKVEIAGVVGLYVLYEAGRGLVADRFELAREHAHDVIWLESKINLLWEQQIQAAVLRLPGVADVFGAAYLSLHLGVTLLLFVWLYRKHRTVFPIARNALIVSTSLALVVHVVFPTAPPRLIGFTLDTVVSRTRINLNSELLGVLYNPIAAMPSMHFGYALLVGFMLAKLSTSRVMRIAGLLYVPLVLFVIVSTGNHFMLDALAGAAVMAAGWLTATAMTRAPRPARSREAARFG